MIGVYMITNIITGDSYIGSSKNIEKRWVEHKSPSTWKKESKNNLMYRYMNENGTDDFIFQVIEECLEPELKEKEQKYISDVQPEYNQKAALGFDDRKYNKNYYSRKCIYNGEELTLNTLRLRFKKSNIPHPTIEAKKYLIGETA